MDRLHGHLDELVAAHDGIDAAAVSHAEAAHARHRARHERLATEGEARQAGGAGGG
jgi:hypothetical protein